ncbi:MAG: copper chaperone PCu(A)C [Candidatus Nanopelagicales bacterium]
MTKLRTHVMTAVAALAAAALLAACGTSTSTSPAGQTPSSASAVAASDPWVKSAKDGMTAAFLTLTNTTGTEQVLVSASTPVSPMVQLHEMAMKDGQMVMQEKKGGIVVPAGGTAVLEPGGNHIMLMGLSAPVTAGEQVPITLTFASGLTLEVSAVGKDFTGAQESYDPSPSMSGM